MSSVRKLSALALPLLWLALGLTLGIYYNYTYFGGAGPLPEPVALAGSFLYYLAVPSEFSAAAQSWLWVLGFPLAGALWLGSLWAFGRLLALGPLRSGRVGVVGVVPLLLPLGWLSWLHAWTPSGPSWRQFVASCEYRQFQASPSAWVTVIFYELALAGLVAQGCVLWGASDAPRWRRALLLPSAFLATLVATGVVGLGLNAVLAR